MRLSARLPAPLGALAVNSLSCCSADTASLLAEEVLVRRNSVANLCNICRRKEASKDNAAMTRPLRAVARAAARDEDGDEDTASEASSVPPLTSDDSDVDDATDALPEEARGAPQEERRSKMLWLLDEDIAASMMVTWLEMTPQQVEDEVRELEGIMGPVAQFHGGSMLVRELQNQPARPAEGGPPQPGKHMGPRASRGVMVWVQTVKQATKLLHYAAETLGTTSSKLKPKLIRTTKSYDGMWRLLQPALQKNPLLIVDYRALQLLFKATDEAVQGAAGSVEATLNMTTEQLINTVADLTGKTREQAAMQAAQPNGHATLATWFLYGCKYTGYLDFETQTASGCIRSDLTVPVCCVCGNQCPGSERPPSATGASSCASCSSMAFHSLQTPSLSPPPSTAP